jgi:cell division protein FtsN
MATERSDEGFREVRLEGMTLVIVGGLLLGSLTGAFLLGRWVERRSSPLPDRAAAEGADPLGQVVEPTVTEDTTATRNWFDETEGGQKQAEPARQVVPPRPEAPPPEPRSEPATPSRAEAAPQTAAAAGGGAYFVQVAAVRDATAADALIRRLTADGFEANAVGGDGALLRVRVGGYRTEEAARDAVRRLRQGGHPDAFLTQVR